MFYVGELLVSMSLNLSTLFTIILELRTYSSKALYRNDFNRKFFR